MLDPFSWQERFEPRPFEPRRLRWRYPNEWAALHFTHYNVIGCLTMQTMVVFLWLAVVPVVGVLLLIPICYVVYIVVKYHTHIRTFVSLSQVAKDFVVTPLLNSFAIVGGRLTALEDRLLDYDNYSMRYIWIAILNACFLVWTFLTYAALLLEFEISGRG
jgi:hypothetical protein